MVGPRVGGPAQQHGAGIIGSSRRARRRDERDPQVAETEHDLWQVDDDLPAVIEAPAPADLRDEPPGPYIGGGRRT
ncbi:hypothetical protein [Micromonospora sp. DT31]|uniref:hypothetical protein n=1 Tax=Micromonospora sp. DT31 TaxID=3393434 RepID=UPI003CF40F51